MTSCQHLVQGSRSRVRGIDLPTPCVIGAKKVLRADDIRSVPKQDLALFSLVKSSMKAASDQHMYSAQRTTLSSRLDNRARLVLRQQPYKLRACSTSPDTFLPEVTAPSMYPFHTSEYSVPANQTCPCRLP